MFNRPSSDLNPIAFSLVLWGGYVRASGEDMKVALTNSVCVR